MVVETTHYKTSEFLAYTAAKTLVDGKSIFVGTGLPLVAATFAQRSHAPNILVVFEAGGIGPRIPELPISVGGSFTFHQGIMAASMHDVMAFSQAGYVDFGFLGAAQIDMYGNLNTTVIGPHDLPKARLPGSGGANDVGSFCHQTIIMMYQDKRRFVNKLDFVTTPGYLNGPGAREKCGLPANTGPYRVITQLATYDFDEETKRMRLLTLHPGITVEQVQENSSFEILVPDKVGTTEIPTKEDIEILRSIDPYGVALG